MSQKQSPDKRDRLRHLRLVVLLLFSLIAWAAVRWSDSPAEFLVIRDRPVHTDAAMVFGGDPDYERTQHASRLLREGFTEFLILCGGEPGPGDSAASLRQHALRHGVPEDRILMERRSTSTFEAVLFANDILKKRQIRSITLVTSPYHQRRAFLVTRKHLGDDVTLVNSPAEPSSWSPEGWWRSWRSVRIVLTEYGKLAYYWARGWI